MNSLTPYLLAIGSNLCFGTASIWFAKLSKEKSPMWMNQIKASIALIGFLISWMLFESFVPQPGPGILLLLFSGFIGLCVGDIFLFKAYTSLGAARTLVLYSFQPFMLAVYGYLFLHQSLNGYQLIAILCMIGCVLTFVIERNKTTGRYDGIHFLYAFLGIFLDAIGIMCSRQAYEWSPSLGSFQVNTIRAVGAVAGFLILQRSGFFRIYADLFTSRKSVATAAVIASVFGTFFSLFLYLQALKTAHVATLTAVSITGPVWVSIIEHLRDRSWPNRYLWMAFLLFLLGFAAMVIGG